MIVTIRFQWEFKDQTVYYYAQTKAGAPKIKVLVFLSDYLGVENLFNKIHKFDFKDILKAASPEQRAHRVSFQYHKFTTTRRGKYTINKAFII